MYLFRGWVAGCEDDDLDDSAPTSFSVVGGYVRAQYEPSDASLLEVRGPLIHLILSFSHSLILVLVLISRSSPSHLAEHHLIAPSPLRRRSAAALELPASYGGDDWRRSYVLYANGFDASGAAPAAGTFALHHPGGAVMKISFDDDAPTSSAGCTYTTAGTHWQVVLIGLRQRRFSCRRHPLVSGSPKANIIIVIVCFLLSFLLLSPDFSRFLWISTLEGFVTSIPFPHWTDLRVGREAGRDRRRLGHRGRLVGLAAARRSVAPRGRPAPLRLGRVRLPLLRLLRRAQLHARRRHLGLRRPPRRRRGRLPAARLRRQRDRVPDARAVVQRAADGPLHRGRRRGDRPLRRRLRRVSRQPELVRRVRRRRLYERVDVLRLRRWKRHAVAFRVTDADGRTVHDREPDVPRRVLRNVLWLYLRVLDGSWILLRSPRGLLRLWLLWL